VPAAEIAVSEGVVAHAGMARKASFGEFAARAARQAVPSAVPLKDPANFRIVGNERLTRLDAHAKSSGRQQFAIDVMLPGMMTAVVMRPPRFGGKVSSFDASKAKAVPGVVDVVQIPRGVAVVGRDMWSARKGREALSVNWDESAAEKRGTAELMKEYRFEAAHLLPRVPPGHKCARMHGHSYEVTVRLAGPVDPRLGWVRDFGDVSSAWKPLFERLDHHLLNEIEGLENPTSENLARWLWSQLRRQLPELSEIAVKETATAGCVYRGE